MRSSIDYSRELLEVWQAIYSALPDKRDLDYWIQNVSKSYISMFDRFCPYKVGDKVQLIRTPVIEKGNGWMGAKHFLVEGATAEVRQRDFRDGKFFFYLVFDNESYLHYQTKEQLPVATHSLYTFTEDDLAGYPTK